MSDAKAGQPPQIQRRQPWKPGEGQGSCGEVMRQHWPEVSAAATNRTRISSCGWSCREAEETDPFAPNVLPVVKAIRASGVSTFAGIAAALNARGLR